MKTISIYLRLSSVAIGVFLSTLSYAQQIKDVFVLVDQSGTMSNSSVNNEAKQIICDMITGQLSLNDWRNKNWQAVSAAGAFFNASPTQMVKNGGKLCLIPFGNMERVRNHSICTYSDNDSAQQFIKDKFPSVFGDSFTYLNLAKAYTVHVASSNGIVGRSVYMIIYTDGMGDYAKNNTYPDDLQAIVDEYGTDAMSSLCKKKGVLRKSTSNRNYDIEVWELGPIPLPPDVPPRTKITITEPKDGEYKGDVVTWERGEEHTIKWKGSAGTVSINVQRKEANDKSDDKYSNIPNKERKDYYKVDIGSNAAKIKFFEPGDYRLIVADSKGRDERYVHVPTPFPFFTIMIIILAVIGGIIVYKKIINHPIPEPGPGNDGWEAKHGNNNSDDWE